MPNNLQTLIHELSSSNPTAQAVAAEAIARLGKNAQPAATALVAALRSADAPTREWCSAALDDLGPPATSEIQELIQLAGSQSLDAAYWAITLLGRARDGAAPAVSTLVNILKSSPDSALRERAAWALGKIGPASKSAIPALQEAAHSNDPRVARLAKQALDELEL